MNKVVKKFNDDKYFYTKQGVYMNTNMKEAHILRY
jgi:hypothetical protein